MLQAVEQAASRRWGPVEELLASVVDAVNALHVTFIKANSPEGTSVPDVTPVPRPNQPQRRSWSDLALALVGRR